jgi:hypothetical protein
MPGIQKIGKPYLKLYVPGVLDASLKIHTIIAKSSSGLTPGLLHTKKHHTLENSPFVLKQTSTF